MHRRPGIGIASAGLAVLLLLAAPVAADGPHRVKVVTDEAEAALAILDARAMGAEVTEALWERLRRSEGFVRLKRRQESFGATEVEAGMREYLLSAEALAARPALAAAVARWRGLDPSEPLARATEYLPAGAVIRATVYPVVKRSTNSFVFELQTDPAIFFHLDPSASTERITGILAHELHHVGTAGCAAPEDVAALPPGARSAVEWLGGFNEGIAVLAAAGGPDRHPHASSPPDEWLVWQRDVARFDEGVSAIGEFLRGVLKGSWTPEEQQGRFLALINSGDVPQGPFYTVGWQMAAAVEKAMGRGAVVASVCDPRRLLVAFGEVAGAHPRADGRGFATWSPELLQALGAAPGAVPSDATDPGRALQ